jgi:hypothetical protein
MNTETKKQEIAVNTSIIGRIQPGLVVFPDAPIGDGSPNTSIIGRIQPGIVVFPDASIGDSKVFSVLASTVFYDNDKK